MLPPQVAVVQFSNDVRVELPLEPLDCAAFHTLMASMVCMSQFCWRLLHVLCGSTNAQADTHETPSLQPETITRVRHTI